MCDRSMRSGTKLAREIQLTDWSTPRNLSNRSSGVQIPRDICTRFGRYLYSTRCSWIINICYLPAGRSVLGKTVPKVSSMRPRAVLKTEGTVFPNTDRPRPANDVFIFFFRRVLCKQFLC